MTTNKPVGRGPLSGYSIIEIGSLGPGPFAAMMLADMGAHVIRIERRAGADFGVRRDPKYELTRRGRHTLQLDLKAEDDVKTALELIRQADGLIEGFRPGVMERLGLGPEVCLEANPHLVYGRMTGWGQYGPLAQKAGHDINYLALSGSLSLIGTQDGPPIIPCNLVGDYGGGGTYLAFGMVCGLLETKQSGKGQIIDAAIVDGVASLSTYFHGLRAGGYWTDSREDNLVDGGAPFYAVYETSDGKYVAVGAIERRFYERLLATLQLHEVDVTQQHDKSAWPALKQCIASTFRQRTREEWCAVFADVDACFSPVLTMEEAVHHPHMVARRTFIDANDVWQPAPAPRFSRTVPTLKAKPTEAPA